MIDTRGAMRARRRTHGPLTSGGMSAARPRATLTTGTQVPTTLPTRSVGALEPQATAHALHSHQDEQQRYHPCRTQYCSAGKMLEGVHEHGYAFTASSFSPVYCTCVERRGRD